MKIETEVYNLNEELFYMRDNAVTKFYPKALRIDSSYHGYSGENWGDVSCGRGGGFPIHVLYAEDDKSPYIHHKRLFRSKEELIASL